MRVDAKGGDLVWKVLYEAKSQIIRAADVHARAFLGCWVRLVRELRAPYASAIQGLAPMVPRRRSPGERAYPASERISTGVVSRPIDNSPDAFGGVFQAECGGRFRPSKGP